jgi:hypothetical protein
VNAVVRAWPYPLGQEPVLFTSPFKVLIIDKLFKCGLNQIGRTLLLGVTMSSKECEVELVWLVPDPASVIKGGQDHDCQNFMCILYKRTAASSVANPHHFNENPDPDPACHFDPDLDPCHFDPDPTFHFDADPDPVLASKQRLKTLKNALVGSYSIHFGLSSAD